MAATKKKSVARVKKARTKRKKIATSKTSKARRSSAKKSKKGSAKKNGTPKDICFAIMPFGGWFDKYYEEIFVPAIESCDLVPRRADDLYRPSNIVQDIWSLTNKAKIIIADLTNKNPNVFYELGLAHSLAKPAILITQSMEDVPFDLRSLRVIQYDKNSPDWELILRENIEKAIEETLVSPDETVPTAFLQTKNTSIHEKSNKKEILDLKQKVSSLERELFRAKDSEHFNRKDINSLRNSVANMASQGYPESMIVKRLSQVYKIPSSLIRQVIYELNYSIK